MNKKDKEDLRFVYDRLNIVHGERSNFDYMIRLEKLINSIDKPVEYSREFKKMPAWEMARVMEVEGVTLEFQQGGLAKYFREMCTPFMINNRGYNEVMTLNWTEPCRVYQEPKTETRYHWENNTDTSYTRTKNKMVEPPDRPSIVWSKVEGSEEEFEIEGDE